MPTKTKIEWADFISNPLKAAPLGLDTALRNAPTRPARIGHACIRLSEGCAHCWASTFNVRLGTGLEYTVPNMDKVELFLDERELERLATFQPRGPFKNGRQRALLFPCDMTDLFGSWVPEELIARIFEGMAKRADIDFLVLTKRPMRMAEFAIKWQVAENIILGASVENQLRALGRWDPMRKIAKLGWKTAISYEPALGAVSWEPWDFINLLICGGESGHGARPMHPDWAKSARDFCQSQRIPYFFKQWGEFAPVAELVARGMTTFKNQPFPVDVYGTTLVKVGRGMAGHLLDGVEWRQMPGGVNG